MKEFFISIITPAYNSGKFIRETIESVRAQTFENWEMIVVDDCSMDNTCSIVEKYHELDNRIMLIRLTKNAGAARARNIGIEHAKGDFIAFLDSDDIWYPNKLLIQLRHMIRFNASVSFTSYLVMSPMGKITGVVKAPLTAGYKTLLKGCNIGCSTLMYNVGILGKRFFNLDHPYKREDYVLWLEIAKYLAKSNSMIGIVKPLAVYRKHEAGISANKWKVALDQWSVYRRIEKLSLPSSTYYFIFYTWNGLRKHYFSRFIEGHVKHG